LVLHSAGSNGYREPDSYFDRGVGVAIFPRDDAFNDGTRDPYTGQTRFHSGWYGYATNGVAVNHTERRLIRYLRLALEDADLKIDPARVYVRGTSMGGGGALHLAYHYPHLFAAAAPTIGWVDPDAWSRGIWAKEFGEPPARMPVNAQGGPSWWDWQNMAWMVDNWPGRLPPVLHTFRKDDDIIDERAYPALLEKTEKSAQGQISQWQDGGHRGFSLKENAEFLRFRRDEAYPAFSDAASSDPFAAQEGQRNLNLDWSSRHRDLFPGEADAIADSLSGFAMTFKSMAADAQVDVTPRNTQRFHPLPGDTVRWVNRAQSGGALLDSGTAVADARGLVTARIRVIAAGNRLSLACAACGAPSRRALLKGFILPEINPLPVGAVDHARKTVTLTVPGQVDIASLRPHVEHTGSSLQPASGAAVDFSSPVEYKVTGSGAEAVYTVEIKRGPVSIRRKRDIPDLRKPDGRKSKPSTGGAMRPRNQGNPMLLGPDASGDWYSANGRMQAVFPPQSTFP
jgi:dienelactone hydrolase